MNQHVLMQILSDLVPGLSDKSFNPSSIAGAGPRLHQGVTTGVNRHLLSEWPSNLLIQA